MDACCPSFWYRGKKDQTEQVELPPLPEVTIGKDTPSLHTEEDERYRKLGQNAEMLSQMYGVDIYSFMDAISKDGTFDASPVDEQANTEEASNELQCIGNRIVRANSERIGHVVLRSGQSIDVFEVYTEKQQLVGWPTSLLTKRRVYFCGKPASDGSRGRVVGSVIVRRCGDFKPCRPLRPNVVTATGETKRAWSEGVQEALLLCVTRRNVCRSVCVERLLKSRGGERVL